MNTYYVNNNHAQASDANPGTEALPWFTIQKAANTLGAEDTVHVQAGNYDEFITITHSGLAGKMITFRAAAGDNVVTKGFWIKGDYVKVEGFEVTDTLPTNATGLGIALRGSDSQIVGNYIHDTYGSGIGRVLTSDELHRVAIISNTIYKTRNAGIYLAGTGHLIEGNDISYTQSHFPGAANVTDSDGIRIFGSDHVIKNNFIHDIRQDIYAETHIDSFQTWAESTTPPVRNSTFQGNLCMNIGDTGVQMTSYTPPTIGTATGNVFRGNVFINMNTVFNMTNIQGITIENNTFINLSSGIGGGLGSHEFHIRNNIFYDVGRPYQFFDPASRVDTRVDYNLSYLYGPLFYLQYDNPAYDIPVDYTDPNGIFGSDPLFVADHTNNLLTLFADIRYLDRFRVMEAWNQLEEGTYKDTQRAYLWNKAYRMSESEMDVLFDQLNAMTASEKSAMWQQLDALYEQEKFLILGPDSKPFTEDDGLRLRENSPAIGAGQHGADIGAYAVGRGGEDTVAPSTPTGFHVF